MSGKEAGLRGFGTRPKPLINPSPSAPSLRPKDLEWKIPVKAYFLQRLEKYLCLIVQET
jgi:hypothetical protein